jgi:low affinity Fe/Cu permease
MAMTNMSFAKILPTISLCVSDLVGHHRTLVTLVACSAGWVVYGIVAGFTKEWFLISNIGGTVGSFLILIVIRHTKSREALAVQTKLDQLIFSGNAGNHWVGVHERDSEVIDEMRSRHHQSP